MLPLFYIVYGHTAGIISDDFSSTTLNSAVWNLIDPQNDVNLEMTGTQVALTIPTGTDHDAWIGGNTATRIMQTTDNTNFFVEVKFEGFLSGGIQDQGILVEESANRFLRFDIFYDGTTANVFSALIDNSTADVKVNTAITWTSPTWLQVKRTGDLWTFNHSGDGQAWTTITTFIQAFTSTSIGPYIGNKYLTAELEAPAHTILIDYFFNDSSRIDPEDGGQIDNSDPVISNISISPSFVEANISWNTDEHATSLVKYGLSPIYDKTAEDLRIKKNHALLLTGLIPNRIYHYKIFSKDAAGNEEITPDDTFESSGDSEGPVIDVWHGLVQKAGNLGDAQDDINIMGNVYDENSTVSTLTYRLNGGNPVSLSIGDDPNGYGDGRRLATTGDFNADIPKSMLNIGPNIILLTATDISGNVSNINVNLEYQSGIHRFPVNINWGSLNNPQDVGQYVDGEWGLDGGGLRTLRMGYDRLFLMGEKEWQDYEVTVSVKINGIGVANPDIPVPPAVGILMRFTGHIIGGHRNFPPAQPKWGYQPAGGLGWLV